MLVDCTFTAEVPNELTSNISEYRSRIALGDGFNFAGDRVSLCFPVSRHVIRGRFVGFAGSCLIRQISARIREERQSMIDGIIGQLNA